MDLCDANVANKLGKCLTEFLHCSMEITPAESYDAKRRAELQAIIRDSSLGKEERAKQIEEVKQKYLAKSETVSLQADELPQQKEAIYSETGELKHWSIGRDTQNDTKSIGLQRRNELQEIMRDKSLDKEVRARKMEEVKQKYLAKTGVVNLSATAASKKHFDESKALPLLKQQKNTIYSETGELKYWADSVLDDKPDDGALDFSARRYKKKVDLDPDSRHKELINTKYHKQLSRDSQRREELQMIMQDKSLGKVERAKKIDEVKQTYAATSKTERGTRATENELVNLAAVVAAAKEPQGNLQFQKTTVSERSTLNQSKNALYSEADELFKQWRNDDDIDNNKTKKGNADVSTKKYAEMLKFDPDSERKILQFLRKPSLDSRRREELQAIMQDTSLGKAERARKIEEVKRKYVVQAETELDLQRRSELQEIVKEKSAGKGERVKRMKEVKLKYEQKLQKS